MKLLVKMVLVRLNGVAILLNKDHWIMVQPLGLDFTLITIITLGYFLYGISVLAKIELEWEMRYEPQVDSLAADFMNLDKRTDFYYSLVRCFDLYRLHSWAGGVSYKETMQDGYVISKFWFEIMAICLSSRLFLKLEVKFQLKRGGVVRTQLCDQPSPNLYPGPE
ncbi:putative endo-1,3(4)-beta-glucanase [Rosa chinensis]|uniref:glucan endo-1,3-beta-D-glucosidase n=1 Tax=Rosa chinensis TaxID=74649 RepID=A0A2P6QUU8_ROSCH|nr:putative endo-1,3(4)-beta-glucanase [Rosa chinensis]